MKIITKLISNILQQYLRYNKLKILIVFRYELFFSKSTQFFADFTVGMIENETGHLLKCVTLYRKCINLNET